MSFVENTRKPIGLGGKMMVAAMNIGHGALADWGFEFLHIPADASVLDCGCGGGANLKKLTEKCPDGMVRGIDYSEVSVQTSQKKNQSAIQAGKCEVLQANVMKLPFKEQQFDLVTAFETIYFWQDLSRSFAEIYRVLKPGGMFFICNESSGDTDKDDKWMEKIEGMTIYKDVQLQEILKTTGFQDIQIHKNQKGWLCMTAEKMIVDEA